MYPNVHGSLAILNSTISSRHYKKQQHLETAWAEHSLENFLLGTQEVSGFGEKAGEGGDFQQNGLASSHLLFNFP